MVNCNQQAQTWECGYILLQSMFDSVNVYQKQFPKVSLFLNYFLDVHKYIQDNMRKNARTHIRVVMCL
ncbi:hypothetical protein Hanom_Chr14g01252111 [Helianthus anomalus]